MHRLLDLSRAGEWWHHKVPIALATGYAACLHVDRPVIELAGRFGLGVLVLAAGATYVSLVNDFTDLDADRRAGKTNRLAGRSRSTVTVALAVALIVGAGLLVALWALSRAAAVAAAAAYVAFTLYSVPPMRLKGRGIWGVLADACGAHVAPQLMFVALVAGVEAWWVATAGLWAAAVGVRGALWHQLGDVDADTHSGVRTFGATHPSTARLLIVRVVFPVELVALAAVLLGAAPVPGFLALVAYALVEWLRARHHNVRIVLVAPAPRYRIALQELYSVVLPLALLAGALVRDHRAAFVLAAHIVLFPIVTAHLVLDLGRGVRLAVSSVGRGVPATAPSPPVPTSPPTSTRDGGRARGRRGRRARRPPPRPG